MYQNEKVKGRSVYDMVWLKKYKQYQTNNVSSKILCIQKKMLFELEAILEGLK